MNSKLSRSMSESNEGRDSETSKRVELQESFNCGGEERRSCKQESGELAGDLCTQVTAAGSRGQVTHTPYSRDAKRLISKFRVA